MLTWFSDPETCLLLCIRLAAAGVVIWTLEYLSQYRAFRKGGLYDWTILRDLRGFTAADTRIARSLDVLLGYPGILFVLIIRLLPALLLLFFASTFWCRLVGITGVYLTNILLFHVWTPYRRASDVMILMLFGVLLLVEIGGESPFVVQAALWFIALQACISYCGNGIVKIGRPLWMNGMAVLVTANNLVYGTRPVAFFLHPRPRLTKFLTWSTLAMECLFPLVLITGYPGFWLFLGWGFVFHIVNTYLSGLNSFFWSYIAMYPAVIYTAISVQKWMESW